MKFINFREFALKMYNALDKECLANDKDLKMLQNSKDSEVEHLFAIRVILKIDELKELLTNPRNARVNKFLKEANDNMSVHISKCQYCRANNYVTKWQKMRNEKKLKW